MTMTTKMKDILLEVVEERRRQNQKWGIQKHDEFKWLAILGEEVGEANKAVLESHFNGDSLDNYRKELIQVAAVAVAMIECLDNKIDNDDKKGYVDTISKYTYMVDGVVCGCGIDGFYVKNTGSQVGAYCIKCNTWIKWLNKSEKRACNIT